MYIFIYLYKLQLSISNCSIDNNGPIVYYIILYGLIGVFIYNINLVRKILVTK